jgi:hypothetical protein
LIAIQHVVAQRLPHVRRVLALITTKGPGLAPDLPQRAALQRRPRHQVRHQPERRLHVLLRPLHADDEAIELRRHRQGRAQLEQAPPQLLPREPLAADPLQILGRQVELAGLLAADPEAQLEVIQVVEGILIHFQRHPLAQLHRLQRRRRLDELHPRRRLRPRAQLGEELRVPAARRHRRVAGLAEPRLLRVPRPRAQDQPPLAEILARHPLHVRPRHRLQALKITQLSVPAAARHERVRHRQCPLAVVLPAGRLGRQQPLLQRQEAAIVELTVADPAKLLAHQPLRPAKALGQQSRQIGDHVEVRIHQLGRHIHRI